MKEKTNRFTAEERMRCAKVAKVFEAFMWESDFMWASDAGPFGYTVLCDYYKDEFSNHKTYTSAKELFEHLWIEYMYYNLLKPVKGTPLADLDYEKLYARLSDPEQEAFWTQGTEFIVAAGLEKEVCSTFKL